MRKTNSHTTGHSAGYAAGRTSGRATGRTVGRTAGRAAGHTAAHTRGRAAGHTSSSPTLSSLTSSSPTSPTSSSPSPTLPSSSSSPNTQENARTLLSRRHFLYGAGAAAALAIAGGTTYAIVSLNSNEATDAHILSVPENNVSTLDNLEEVDRESAFVLTGNFDLPYGTLVWSNSDSIAACLLPTDQAKPLTQIGLLFLDSGQCPTAISAAIGQDEGFEIYDVRANDAGLVWAEANILEGSWRIYSAALNDDALQDSLLLDSGTSDWEMPSIAAVGTYAFWQVLPKSDGSAKSENSKLKRASFGTNKAEEVYSSLGRMNTPIYATQDSVVITPRTSTTSIHYQLTCIDAKSAQVSDALILPTSMKPLEAGYGEYGFMFSFDSIYNYGDGIANLGTYVPNAKVLPAQNADGEGNEAYSNTNWFRFPRNPTAAPAWCGSWFMVKSTSAVCAVNLAEGSYCSFDVKSGSESYGEYLASTGKNARIVTYSNIDYQPLDGDEQKYCNVRVWEIA